MGNRQIQHHNRTFQVNLPAKPLSAKRGGGVRDRTH